MVEVMKKIEYSRGRNVLLDTPLSMSRIDKQCSPIDAHDPSIGYIIHQKLILATQTRIAQDADDEEHEFINHRAAQMFTEELYNEVARDLFKIMRHCHEHVYNPDLMNMLDELIRKVRP